jgi:hypothetical protein
MKLRRRIPAGLLHAVFFVENKEINMQTKLLINGRLAVGIGEVLTTLCRFARRLETPLLAIVGAGAACAMQFVALSVCNDKPIVMGAQA